MTKDPFLVFMKELTEVGDKLEKLHAKSVIEESRIPESPVDGSLRSSVLRILRLTISAAELLKDATRLNIKCLTCRLTEMWSQYRTSLISEKGELQRIGGRRVADAIVVSAVVLLSFVYHYLIGYIDRGGSKTGSSVSLDFRDIYISIVLFQAAYVWIKFRDVIPRGAVYHRRDSNKFEPRIKFPVTRGVGGKSKRVPLGLHDTKAEGEVAYQIAAFYCKKRKHTGRLDLGGGAYFPIPALSLDPNLPYEEKVKQVGDQVLKVYAEFEERKASRNLPPSVSRLAFEMPTGEGHLLATSPIQELRQPVNSRMDSSMQGQGSQLGSNIHNGVDFNNPSCLLLLHAETQHELLGAYKQHEHLKAQVSRTEIESMGWEVKYSELERRYLELEQRNSELEHENGLLNRQILQLQSQLQIQHQEPDFDTNRFFSMGHEESLASACRSLFLR